MLLFLLFPLFVVLFFATLLTDFVPRRRPRLVNDAPRSHHHQIGEKYEPTGTKHGHLERIALQPRCLSHSMSLRPLSPGLCIFSAMLTIILIVLLVMALGDGGWGHSRYGAAGWSPAGILILVLVVMFFTGHL
ncbi:MAG: hypothetical protein ABIP39_02795 [Polyangiaceae bacterium]